MDTFLNLTHWFQDIKNQSEPDALIFLVANKKDREEEREVSYEKGAEFAQENRLAGFTETSAKTGENVEKTFINAAKQLFKKYYRKIRESQLQAE